MKHTSIILLRNDVLRSVSCHDAQRRVQQGVVFYGEHAAPRVGVAPRPARQRAWLMALAFAARAIAAGIQKQPRTLNLEHCFPHELLCMGTRG